MIKHWHLFVSLFWGITFSAYGVIFNEVEKGDLATLQRHASRLSAMTIEVTRRLKDEHGQSLQHWVIPPAQEALQNLVEVDRVPERPWPRDIFPQTIDGIHTPNLRQCQPLLREFVKITQLMGYYLSFTKELNRRKSTPLEYAFDDEEHFLKWQSSLTDIIQMHAQLNPCLRELDPLYKKYATRYSRIIYLLWNSGEDGSLNHLGPLSFQDQFKPLILRLERPQYENRGGSTNIILTYNPPAIEPYLKITPNTVQDEFAKTKLFLEATVYVHGSYLNLLGNILRLQALKYQEVGDGSLMTMLSTIQPNSSVTLEDICA